MSHKFFLMRYWKKLSITTKFTLSFAVVVLLILIMALTGFLAFFAIRNQTEIIFSSVQSQQAGQETEGTRIEDDVARASRQIDQISQLAIIAMGITLIGAIILAIVTAFIVNRSITRNVVKLTEAAQQLQQGNLQTTVEIDSFDELGRLASIFNHLTQQFADLVDDLEAETVAAQSRLIEAIESISEGFSLYDTNDRLRLYNNKYRELHGSSANTISTGTKFEKIIRTAAEQGHYVDAINRVDEWVQKRINHHRNPQGILEQQLTDGRWIQISEYTTSEGGIFGIQTDITQRKEAENSLLRQNDYLQALHEITIDLLGHLDLKELLEDIINRAGELLGTHHGYIYLAEPGYDEIERKVGIGIFYNQTLGFRLKAGEGVAGKVWQTGKPLLVNNFNNWTGEPVKIDYKNIYSIAGVPLKSGQQIAGIIGMAYDVDTGKCFEESEVELLSRFAQLASIALDNARLYTTAQEEKTRSDNLLNVVIPIGVALSAEQNFDRLLENILLEAKTFCNADAGTLYLRTDTDELNFVIVQNDSLNISMGGTSSRPIDFPPVALYDKGTNQPNHSNVAAHATLTGNSINIPDAYWVDGFNFTGTKEFDARTGYRSTSFLTIPLKNAHDHVVGVLQLINALDQDTGRIIPFSRHLEQTTNTLSSLATVALEAYIREQELRQKIQQLKIEIDEAKRQKQVSEIVETDFFHDLQIKARNIRRRSQGGRSKES